jgi:hypothetical protein
MSNPPSGKMDTRQKVMLAASIVGIVAAFGIVAYQIFGGPPSAAQMSRMRAVVDSETGEVNEKFPIPDKGNFPWTNPKTGKPTLYPAETCFWTKDGKAKLKPTFVLLNQYAGKPGDTICPDCGRKVTTHNPMPPAQMMADAARDAEGR